MIRLHARFLVVPALLAAFNLACGTDAARDREDDDPVTKDGGKTSDGGDGGDSADAGGDAGTSDGGGDVDGGEEHDGGVNPLAPRATINTPNATSGDIHVNYTLI